MIDEKKDNDHRLINCSIERSVPMIRILICDDDNAFSDKLQMQIEDLLDKKSLTANIHTYESMEKIGDPILRSCDIAFLDIDFANNDYSGLDIARKLRSMRSDAVIIFVTNYIEYAPEGYEVQAFRYSLKSDIFDKLENYLQLSITKLLSAREKFKIQVNGEIIDLPIEDILYVESQLHTVTLIVQKDKCGKRLKEYTCYASIGELEKQLTPLGFLRVHKSYLVNMRYIKKYQCREIQLTNNTVIRASVKNYREQKEKYLLWKGVE